MGRLKKGEQCGKCGKQTEKWNEMKEIKLLY